MHLKILTTTLKASIIILFTGIWINLIFPFYKILPPDFIQRFIYWEGDLLCAKGAGQPLVCPEAILRHYWDGKRDFSNRDLK